MNIFYDPVTNELSLVYYYSDIKKNYYIYNERKRNEKVTGYINVRPLGEFDFEFFISEDMKDEQIKEEIKRKYECYISYETEDGYEEVTETIKSYKKRNNTSIT